MPARSLRLEGTGISISGAATVRATAMPAHLHPHFIGQANPKWACPCTERIGVNAHSDLEHLSEEADHADFYGGGPPGRSYDTHLSLMNISPEGTRLVSFNKSSMTLWESGMPQMRGRLSPRLPNSSRR